MPKAAHKVVVIGHRNPDTDSICSAIAYAELKNKTTDLVCEPRRAGKMNQETEFVLKKFGVTPPRMCTDVNPKIRDVDYREMPGIPGSTSLRKAWEIMRDQQIDTLPITSADNELEGIITVKDLATAKRLAKIAGVDIDEFSTEMFEAGEKLDGKTPEEVFLQDFKVFMCGDIRFGVAQGSYMTRKNLLAAEALLKPYLEEARNKQNVEDLYMLLTDVPKEESVVICTGRYAAEVLSDGFEIQPAEDGSWILPGVVSRKKQFIPAMMSAYQEL